jgi:hypothetical protein
VASSLSSHFKTDEPSYGVALVAVLAGGVISSWVSSLFFGFAPYLPRTGWIILTSVIGAYCVKFVLRVLGYEIGLVAAFAALALGAVVSASLATAMPGVTGPGVPLLPAFGLFSGLASLLLSAWIVQNTASSPQRPQVG